MHGAGLGKGAQPVAELRGGGQPAGVEFRVATGEPAAIGTVVRRFIGERGEGQNLCPRRAPSGQKMRIDKSESVVLRQRDALPGRGDLRRSGRVLQRAPRGGPQGGDIDMGRDEGRRLPQQIGQVFLLSGLHQPEVTLGHFDFHPARQRAEDFDPDSLHPRAHQRLMPGGGDAVQHHARQFHIGPHLAKAERRGRHRLRRPRYVEHQHHRPAHQRRDIGAGAIATGPRFGHPVKQPHRPFAEDQFGPIGIADQPFDPRAVHRPTVEVERRPARGRRVKGRVDVIRAAFERLHRDTFGAQRGQQPQHQGRLAGAGGRGGDQ